MPEPPILPKDPGKSYHASLLGGEKEHLEKGMVENKRP